MSIERVKALFFVAPGESGANPEFAQSTARSSWPGGR